MHLLSAFAALANLGYISVIGYPTEVGALFTTVSSIRVSRVSIMVSVRDSVK